MLTRICIRSLWVKRHLSASSPLPNSQTPFSFTEFGIRQLLPAFKGKLISFGLEWMPSGDFQMPDTTPPSTPSSSAVYAKMVDAVCDLIQLNPSIQNLHIDWPIPLDQVLGKINLIKRHNSRVVQESRALQDRQRSTSRQPATNRCRKPAFNSSIFIRAECYPGSYPAVRMFPSSQH